MREGVVVVNGVVRGGVIGKLAFEQRLERGDRVGLTSLWRPATADPEVGVCWVCWRSSRGERGRGEAEQ